jgi:hypothetical protein
LEINNSTIAGGISIDIYGGTIENKGFYGSVKD